MPTEAPRVMRMAKRKSQWEVRVEWRQRHAHISHQTGATFWAWSFQMMELTNMLRHATAVHIMRKHVPEFQDWRCQGSGTMQQTMPRKAKMGKAGYVGSSIATSGFERSCKALLAFNRTAARAG